MNQAPRMYSVFAELPLNLRSSGSALVATSYLELATTVLPFDPPAIRRVLSPKWLHRDWQYEIQRRSGEFFLCVQR